jgi:DnaJ like chaperone protein
VGALIGAFVGHWLDQEAESKDGAASVDAQPAEIQEAFFRATFQVMGHVAKADGHVSEDEIRAARAMMSELRLELEQIQLAIDFFTEGKSRDFPLVQTLEELSAVTRGRPELKRMFVQIQMQTALRAGSLHSPARKVISKVCRALEISTFELVQIEALLRMQPSGSQTRPNDRLTQAYQVLGVASGASDAEVTKAYRRLMNQNHPDKLVAKGLPESMMSMAAEKTRQIRAAYELVCAVRGMR